MSCVSWCCIIVDLMDVSRQDDDPHLVLMPGRSLNSRLTVLKIASFQTWSRAGLSFSNVALAVAYFLRSGNILNSDIIFQT